MGEFRIRLHSDCRGQTARVAMLDMDTSIKHCTAGLGIWEWASNDEGGDPDVVMACCGDVPTLETLAAVEILRKQFPDRKFYGAPSQPKRLVTRVLNFVHQKNPFISCQLHR
jgi:hypothetical protein